MSGHNLRVDYNGHPGAPVQQRCQCSSRISAGTAGTLSLSVQALMLAVVTVSDRQ